MQIVGRDADLAALERFLDRAAEANGALVVEGEPGIGKTTIWREALARASKRGFQVLAARPAEAEAALSFAALADLLGAVHADLRSNLPAPQRQALDVALLHTDAELPADPRSTAMGFLGILRALAAESPVLVAVDDVQWLDRASERALEFAARRLPTRIGLLAARRSDGSGDAPLGISRALPEECVERAVLGPFSLAALHHLIRSHLGAAPARPVLVRIATASGGNPFYTLEIARMLVREGLEPAPGERLPIPDSLQELVMTRVDALSGWGREAVLAAAALSRPTVPMVAATLGAQEAAEAAIVEAEEAGVIDAEHMRIRFLHPLLASAVYASASRVRLRELHQRLAEVVSDPEERARHLAQSATESDGTAAAEIESAADRAAQRGAQDAAAELYGAAARLTPDDRSDDVARRLLGEAAALFAAGDPGGARAVAEAALARADAQTFRAEAQFLLSRIAWVERPGRQPIDRLEHALALAGDDRRLRGRIHAKLAEFSLLDQQRALEHADAAAALLDEDEDSSLLADVLVNKLFFSAQTGRGAHRDLLERALRLEERAGPEAEKNRVPLIWFIGMDEAESARARYALEDRWYRDRGEEGWRAERLGLLALAELHAGNWQVADQVIEDSCTAIEQMGQRVGPWAAPFYIRSLIDGHRGRIARARDTLFQLSKIRKGPETASSRRCRWARSVSSS